MRQNGKLHFRIGRSTFHYLCTELRPHLQHANVVRKPLTVEERIAITLWRLGTIGIDLLRISLVLVSQLYMSLFTQCALPLLSFSLSVIIQITQEYIQNTVGSIQLCAGQEEACETGIFAMRRLFEEVGADAVLMIVIDASNAFNSPNRVAALRNVRILCPEQAPMLTNEHLLNPLQAFHDGDHILFCEGTTQDDPLVMVMYAIDMVPLIHDLKGNVPQVWYADNVSTCGRASKLREWWDSLQSIGPLFGYGQLSSLNIAQPLKHILKVQESTSHTWSEAAPGSDIGIKAIC